MCTQRLNKCDYPVPHQEKRNAGEYSSPPHLLSPWFNQFLNEVTHHHTFQACWSIYPPYKILRERRKRCFGHDEMREELEGEDKLPGHCQDWHFESEKLEIQGGRGWFYPSANFFTHEQTGTFHSPKRHERISGTYLWLKSFEVTGCKVTGCEELKKNKGVFLSETSQSLHRLS